MLEPTNKNILSEPLTLRPARHARVRNEWNGGANSSPLNFSILHVFSTYALFFTVVAR